jgi:DNA-binding transcriptional LysR family regulator
MRMHAPCTQIAGNTNQVAVAARKLRCMLDARRLRVLCAVADHATLAAAADALSYTPSAVSQQIVALEREVGVRLLHRGPKGVRLTSPGQVLVDQARTILAGLATAEASVAAAAGLREGRLHLASFATAGAALLPRAIAAFRAEHPGVTVTLSQADPDAAIVALRAGDVDLIITADDGAGELDGVEVIPLLEDPLRVVIPDAHALADEAAIALGDLAADVWVDTPAGSEARRLMLGACGRAGFIPRVAFESDEYATIQELVAAGAGVALIPRLALRRSPPGVQVRPLTGPPVVRRVMAAVHVPEYRAPAADAMLAMLKAVAARERAASP